MAKRCKSCGAEQTKTEREFLRDTIWTVFFALFMAFSGWLLGDLYVYNHHPNPNPCTVEPQPSARISPITTTAAPHARLNQIFESCFFKASSAVPPLSWRT